MIDIFTDILSGVDQDIFPKKGREGRQMWSGVNFFLKNFIYLFYYIINVPKRKTEIIINNISVLFFFSSVFLLCFVFAFLFFKIQSVTGMQPLTPIPIPPDSSGSANE